MAERIHEPRTPVDLRPAWRLSDPAIERDAELFWQSEGLLPTKANVATRLAGLCLAGYDSGKLIALAEARILFIDFLEVKLAMLRVASARDVRRNRLATYMAAKSRELLEAWSLANPAEEVMGMGTITQSPALNERERRARGFLRDTRLGFVGWTANGEPMRVAWFEHGTVPNRRLSPQRPYAQIGGEDE